MITVNDIRDVKFRKTNLGGYRPEDVDVFLDEVQDSYEKLQRENVNLTQKIKILADRINQYRQDEDSVKTALVSAQKLADMSVLEARKEAESIVTAAKNEANRLVTNANNEILAQRETLLGLKKAVKDFRANILSLYKDHLKLVNSFNAEDRLPANFAEDAAPAEQVSPQETQAVEVGEKAAEEAKETAPSEKANDVIVDISSNSRPSSTANSTSGAMGDTASKFSDLKFGEDYDLSRDASESPLGLFS